jgi:hypothetical protein
VAVKCICPNACSIKHGTRVKTVAFREATDFFTGYKPGNGPITIPNPIMEIETALGKIIAAGMSSNFPDNITLTKDTIDIIVDKIKGALPTKPRDGNWLDNKSPCK